MENIAINMCCELLQTKPVCLTCFKLDCVSAIYCTQSPAALPLKTSFSLSYGYTIVKETRE